MGDADAMDGPADPAEPAERAEDAEQAEPADGVLTPSEVEGEIAARGLGWRRDGDVLVKEVRLGSFRAALAYVLAVGELAEATNHHPDIDIRWRTVVLRLTTHSAGGLTELDLALAAGVDELTEAEGIERR